MRYVSSIAKLNKTELAIRDAVLDRMAGPLLGGKGHRFSAATWAGLNGRSLQDAYDEAEKIAKRIYREVEG